MTRCETLVVRTAVVDRDRCRSRSDRETTFTDHGVLGMSTVEDALTLDSGVDYVFSDADYRSFVDFETAYIEELREATVIVVGRPTGRLSQHHYSLAQEIEIEEVIRGGRELIGMEAYIYGNYGFAVNKQLHADADVVYYAPKRIMQRQHPYLIFLTPLELNPYLPEAGYRLVDSFFSYLDLGDAASTVLEAPLDQVSYLEAQESEFFSRSQQVLDQLLHIKERIVARYMGE